MQATLRRVRSIIRKALPGAEEVISYQIPAYRLHDRCVIYLPGGSSTTRSTPRPPVWSRRSRKDLAPYPVSKGTIRFPLGRPVPGTLIAGIAKFLAREAAARLKAKPAGPKKVRYAGRSAASAGRRRASAPVSRAALSMGRPA